MKHQKCTELVFLAGDNRWLLKVLSTEFDVLIKNGMSNTEPSVPSSTP